LGKRCYKRSGEKATSEYRKYKTKNLSEVEKDYLDAMKNLQKKVEGKVKGK